MNKDIAPTYVRFIDIPGGKRHPVFIVKENDGKIFFFCLLENSLYIFH